MIKPSIRRRPQRSLRTILIIWFLLFSVVPLAFVTGYSVIKYEKAIDRELAQRLNGNAREISIILNEFKVSLEAKRSKSIKDPNFIYNISMNEVSVLKPLVANMIQSDLSTSISVFNKDGRMLASVYKDQRGDVHEFAQLNQGAIYLSNENLSTLQDLKEYSFVEYSSGQKMSLILFSKVFTSSDRHVGYLEQVVDLDKNFLFGLKQRMKLEMVLLRPTGQVVAGTNPDFNLYKKEFFSKYVQPESNAFFDLSIRNVPYGFLMYPLRWGKSDFFLALGASKGDAKAVLRNVNYAFYTVVGAVIFLLIFVILIASNVVLKPLNDLVDAIEFVQSSDRPIEIPIKSDTEIGLLTESFNEMSRNIVQARSDLKKKITELEKTNRDLIDTQSKLVHNSKMVSLGHLVAGVAHELNNPIGFIYSNMAHLKDYSDKLIEMIEIAQQKPQELSDKIKDYDLDFIKTDLPKLVSSCQEGARRTRDIVLGLRNFSRLDEVKLKEVDIHELIENTLNLLTGEIKNRIQIHRDYAQLPKVQCFESQISQVFMNILSNGVQAIGNEGNIWISTKVVGTATNEMVRISFQDSGKGMSKEILDKIFDPFFSTKEVGLGTGLGLSISYGIIENHNGTIETKSEEGIGTEFIIQIPVINLNLIQKLPKS
jgi:two-component system NtrC family sensor kinase